MSAETIFNPKKENDVVLSFVLVRENGYLIQKDKDWVSKTYNT